MATIIFILVFLVVGLYLALNNLGSLLAEDHNGLKWSWISAGVQIKTGGRVENIQLKLPGNIRLSKGQWVFENGRHRIIIFKLPRLRIKW